MQLALPSYNNIKLSIDNGTSEDYHLVDLYYSWPAGWFYRHRLQMAANLLDGVKAQRALEIGTGSGIFIPQLLRHADSLCGVDLHASYSGVQKMLQAEGIDHSRVEFKQGNILSIPYPDQSFELVVCISVLEHLEDTLPALEEIRRVLRPGGAAVLGFPAETPLTGSLFRVLGYEPKDLHPSSHTAILKSAHTALTVQQTQTFPLTALPMYVTCRAVRS